MSGNKNRKKRGEHPLFSLVKRPQIVAKQIGLQFDARIAPSLIIINGPFL